MIRLHELSLQAFRGIPGTVTLNLSAPVTLIYAPNGSGKTTVCEAAEWLLTGSIKRLETPGCDSEQIRCKFALDSTPTIVSATLTVYEETICLERNPDGCRWRINDGRWKKIDQSALLEKLAPSAVEQGVHRGHANPSRQIWLKGSRFLSGEALSTLLDSDDESLSGRQQLFADLLGVGHLHETERQLDGYINEIAHSLREQQNRVDDKNTAIKEREAKVASQAEDSRGDVLAAALDYVRSARELLGLRREQSQRPTRPAVLSTISELRAHLEGRKLRWNDKRQAELRIAPDWLQRTPLEQSLSSDQIRLVTLAADAAENEISVASANEQLLALNSQASRLIETIAAFEDHERGLNAAQTQARPLIAQYLEKLSQEDLSAESAFVIVDSEGTERTRALRLGRLRTILSELPSILLQRQELDTRRSAYEAASISAPSSEAVAALRDQLDAAGQHVSAVRATYERAAGPLDQLRHLARTVTEALGHDETACPVCDHDWETPASLERAIAAAAEGTPASLAQLAQRLRDAETITRQLQDQLLNQNQQLTRAVEAERHLRTLEAILADFSAKVRETGLEPDYVELQTNVELAIARINLVPVLRTLRAELGTTQDILSTPLTAQISILQIHAQLRPQLLAASAKVRTALEDVEQQRKPVLAAVAAGMEAAKKIAAEREGLEHRIHQNGSRLQVLRSGWQTLTDGRVWSDNALSEVSAALRQDHETQQKAETALVQAEAVLRNLSDTEELAQLRAQLVPLLGERDRLNRYSEAAAATRDAYREFRQRHVKQQMADFVRVISALFTRMQCNLVYDDILSGDENAPLSWRAVAEEFSLDPEATFSQGQRQDFALSIFLARARGLGGTFILDEPVAHLDDLNRVALLDVFRAITVEDRAGLSFVLTTANKPLVRHMLEKFARVGAHVTPRQKPETEPVLRLVGLEGNPRTGVKLVEYGVNGTL